MYHNTDRKSVRGDSNEKYLEHVATLADMALASCQGIVPLDHNGKPKHMDTLTAKLFVVATRVKRLTLHKRSHGHAERRKREQYHFEFMDRRI